VLGFSQGVATAARWVTLGSIHPSRLILWGDHIPPDLDMDRAARALDGVDVILARGSRDPVFRADLAAREAEQLRGAGISCRMIEYEGGHDIDQRLLRELAAEAG
jgi:predicted esterase